MKVSDKIINGVNNIINEVARGMINGRFYGTWYVEGNEQEKNTLCNSLQRSFKNKGYVACVRQRRYLPHIEYQQLGRPYRECNKLYLLTVDIGGNVNPPFGSLMKRKA